MVFLFIYFCEQVVIICSTIVVKNEHIWWVICFALSQADTINSSSDLEYSTTHQRSGNFMAIIFLFCWWLYFVLKGDTSNAYGKRDVTFLKSNGCMSNFPLYFSFSPSNVLCNLFDYGDIYVVLYNLFNLGFFELPPYL